MSHINKSFELDQSPRKTILSYYNYKRHEELFENIVKYSK